MATEMVEDAVLLESGCVQHGCGLWMVIMRPGAVQVHHNGATHTFPESLAPGWTLAEQITAWLREKHH